MLAAFQSYVAEVVEVSVNQNDRTFRVHRVVCALDCGRIVNPDTIKAQMQSGIVYGLASLKDEITIDRGRVEQTNFDSYEMLRINEMPVVEVHIVSSEQPPTGVGEPGVLALPRRYATPFSPPPASESAGCRFAPIIWHNPNHADHRPVRSIY
jgi:isoquinoline 1-oxidoreductase beta subunit